MLLDNQAGLSGGSGGARIDDGSRVVAAAYDAAISIISLGDPSFVPSRDARRAIIAAILGDARQHGHSHDRLTLVAIAAAGTRPSVPCA